VRTRHSIVGKPHCAFGGAKAPAEGFQLHSDRAHLDEEGRSAHAGQAAEGLALVAANGSYVFFIRSGSRPIEFEKGKNAIAVPSLDRVPLVIDILITAVRNGELDDQLAQTKKLLTAATSRYSAGLITHAYSERRAHGRRGRYFIA
jgi:hypothetical protein